MPSRYTPHDPIPESPQMPDPVDPDAGLFADIPPWDPQPGAVQFGRIVDPVRAHALTEAVKAVPWPDEGPLDPAAIIALAKQFEGYLAGPDADRP